MRNLVKRYELVKDVNNQFVKVQNVVVYPEGAELNVGEVMVNKDRAQFEQVQKDNAKYYLMYDFHANAFKGEVINADGWNDLEQHEAQEVAAAFGLNPLVAYLEELREGLM